MIVRGVGRAIVGLALVFSATACDDNPLADDREEGAYFRLNPSNVAVDAGGTVLVDAIVVNQYGAATNAPVTATVCDNKITAEPDSARSEYEFPERFAVTGVTLGVSCLVVRGAGLTDTVGVRIVPNRVDLAGIADTLGSGETAQGNLRFLTTTGTDATGFAITDVTFSTLTPTVATVTDQGLVSAQAPGEGLIVTTLHNTWGVARADTTRFVVEAGSFSGTVSESAYQGGRALTINAGAIPFDADTRASLSTGGLPWLSVGSTTSTTSRQFLLPYGLPAGTQVEYAVTNMGPNQIASVGTYTLTAATPGVDAPTVDDVRSATTRTMRPNEAYFGTVSTADADDFIKITAESTGAHEFNLSWPNGSDVDLIIYTATGTAAGSAATLANPEHTSVTLTAGNTYYILVNMWESTVPGATAYALTVTR